MERVSFLDVLFLKKSNNNAQLGKFNEEKYFDFSLRAHSNSLTLLSILLLIGYFPEHFPQFFEERNHAISTIFQPHFALILYIP
jgi:hypothetical protein